MDSKLTNLKTLHTNRWQQDDTPCFIPFPNQSLKYWITTLLLAMMSIVGAWGQTVYDIEFDISKDGASKFYDPNGSIDYRGKQCNITLKNHRFEQNSWIGVCLPFDLSANDLNSTFGEGNYDIQQLKKIQEDGKTLEFEKTTSIVAGKPYFVKVASTIPSPLVFNNVTLSSSLDNGFFRDVNSTEALAFRGFYFPKFITDMYGQNNANNLYEITSSGSLNSPKDHWVTNDCSGTFAYIFVENNSVVPVLQLEGSGNSGEGGDTPVDPSTMTLQQKIDARMQLTDLPTIYIGLPEIGNQSINEYLYKNRSTFEAPYRPATIKVIATSDTSSPHYLESFEETNPLDLEIKVRGNSTSAPDKRPYRLKFAKKGASSDGKAHKHDLLGKGYSKRNWTLLANHFDRTLLRNAIMYHLGTALGMDFNPGYKFVDLVINNEYRGTYQVSDQCEVDGDRINIDEDTGWFVEAARADMVEEPKITAADATWEIKNPEFEDATQLENFKTEVTNWLNTWGNAMNSNNYYFMSNIKGWRAFSDEDSFVKFYLGINLTGDYDGFMTVKAYREADGKLFLGPIWDKDLAFGNYTGDNGETLVENFENGQLRWRMAGLLEDPLFVQKLKAKMDELDAANITKILCDKVDELSDLIKSSRELNYKTWPITLQDAWGVSATSENYQDYIDALKSYLTKHIAFIKKHVDDTYAAICTPETATYNPENDWTSHGLTMKKILNETVANRSLKGGTWNTFCLPFSATQAQVEAALGCTYELKIHSGIDADGETMLFTSPESLDIKGAYPYLIKPLNDVSNMEFTGVINTEVPNNSIPYNGEGVTFDNKHFFYGTLFQASYLNTTTDFGFTSDLYNLGDNLSNVSSISIKGARAFIRNIDGTTPKIAFESTTPPVVRTQLTNLPTIYIDTKDGAAIQPSTGDYVQAAIQVIDDPTTGHLTSFTESEEFLQVRGRGKAEWNVANGKKSYRLKFAKQHKYDLTGAGYTKRNWILAANAADESMIKNALTKKLGDAVGLPFTPNTCFVDLVVNGKYLGTYTAMDYVEADRENGTSKRVNADEKTGWLIEMMNESGVDTSGDVYVAGTNYTRPWVIVKNPEPDYKKTDTDEVKNAAISAVTNPVQTFIDNLWKSPETYVDKTTLVNWYIASEILGGTTTLSSVYAYKDAEDTQLKFGPLWGSELAWQSSAMTDLYDDGTKLGLVVNSSEESALRNLLQSLWNKSWFTLLVASRWLVVKNGLADALKTEADKLKSTISASWTKNYATTESDGAGWTATGNLENDVNTIKTYIDNRIAYLDKKFLLAASDLEYDVTLEDALTAYAGFNNRTVNVTLKNRGTIWGGEWNAICLPFSLTNEQLTAVFGTGYQLKSFKGVTEGDTYNTFNFNDTQTTLDAGVPYIIKPQADVTNLTFNNVTLNLSTDKIVVTQKSDKNNSFKFTGTLQPYNMADDGTDWFIGRNNKAYKSNGTLHACRAYFTMPSTQAAAKAFMFGNLITSIDNIVINDNSLENVKIYNLNGQVVGNSWNAVPQGIYIVNGKKVIK